MRTLKEQYFAVEERFGVMLDPFFKWLQRVSMIWIAGIGVWFFFFETPPVRYLNLPFPVLAPVVFPGDPIVVHIVRTSSLEDDYTFKVDRWLVNADSGDRVSLPAADQTTKHGLSVRDSTNTIVPDDFFAKSAPGRYTLCGSSQVEGVVRNFRLKWCTQEFAIARPGVAK